MPDSTRTPLLTLRTVAAFAALPGIVAFIVPFLLLSPLEERPQPDAMGYAPVAVGVGLLLWCVRDFHVSGKGTLAPWDPPRRLVRVGPYRFTRNPMYVAVTLILVGWALTYRSRSLGVYALIVAVAFHLRVVFGEEPWLMHRYGGQWSEYTARVPRWFVPKKRTVDRPWQS
jgi:protein-S-isoprenylcysteine O-methyltransferase Ste14